MGIVRQESIKATFFSAIGVAIGFFSQVFIFTRLLAPSIVGLIKLIQSFSNLFSFFSLFNLPSITIRFFPYFRNKEKGHHGYLFFAMVFATIGFTFFFILSVIFREEILNLYIEKSKLFTKHFNLVFPIIIGVSLMKLLSAYLLSLFKIVYSAVVKEIYIKVFTLSCVLLYYYKVLDFDGFLISFVGAYALSSILLLLYVISIGEFHIRVNFKLFDKQMVKKMSNYATYGYLSGLVQSSIIEIDKLMIASMVSLYSTGIYGITALFSMILNLPQQAISNISGSLASQAFKDNDFDKIKELYKKTALNQFIIGSLIFMLIWFNVDAVLSFMPVDYLKGKYVILILISMKLFDMGTGINGGIINMSKYYRLMLLFNSLSLILAVTANLLLIPLYDINGAALATCISIIFFNVLKLLFIWWKFKILPFSIQYIKAVGVFVFMSIIAYLIPTSKINIENQNINSFFDIAVKSIIIFAGFTILTLGLRVSEDVNDLYKKTLLRIKSWFIK
ncbi:MAG: polysaccharide biosynthesis C-terminal domain-containing protein [Bacteroidetes bacterium]|nr:polysaccharide biosynthesis C-terminal domain-containing protein [Bacteroidota bacterium]MBL6962981.1 polysaccharide biosynthesis C-terminal domain-containing protein [Bacteroidota bacterium]